MVFYLERKETFVYAQGQTDLRLKIQILFFYLKDKIYPWLALWEIESIFSQVDQNDQMLWEYIFLEMNKIWTLWTQSHPALILGTFVVLGQFIFVWNEMLTKKESVWEASGIKPGLRKWHSLIYLNILTSVNNFQVLVCKHLLSILQLSNSVLSPGCCSKVEFQSCHPSGSVLPFHNMP